MNLIHKVVNRGISLAHNTKVQAAVAGTSMAMVGLNAMAALSADVDTAISASQTDSLAMIAKGYAYYGAIGGALVVLGLFWRILRKPAR
ncbi:TonB-dependent receptor [Novimethylophilus kurashikiensis]|uniref:TonB-dependent receptor n=1 Tax=Novimethylophilus kurashikiensis TaxID=1825523 RepID=A0A2R5FAG0_9PROT|nr:hypothetical protein [Novimethylophilus kurashikiensis]GBG15206.1 TonB-dependent receptor [Novimethylophilus kurashikiensis]